MAFSPDGATVAVGSDVGADASVVLWNVARAAPRLTLDGFGLNKSRYERGPSVENTQALQLRAFIMPARKEIYVW